MTMIQEPIVPASPLKIGLALSGGGYRAAAFHLGTLNKLDELKILSKVDVLSTISGGSITGAAWCLHDGDYPSFHKGMRQNLEQKNVLRYIYRSPTFIKAISFAALFLLGAFYLTFTAWSCASFFVLAIFFVLVFKYQYHIFPVSRVIENAYDDFFFNGKKLSDFNPEKPTIAIGSSNLHTGRPFTFSQTKMSDSGYAYGFEPPIRFKHGLFPIARAVMASSCVPFAFSPVFIDRDFYENPSDADRVRPTLVDGGVYDNQGIQKLTQPKSSYECDIIITSDAGGNFKADKKYPNVIALLVRTVDLFMYRIKSSQMQQNVYRNVHGAAKPIAYFSLGWKLDGLIPGFVNNLIAGQVLKEVVDAHGFDPAWLAAPKQYAAQIQGHLEERTDYNAIIKRDLTNDEWLLAKNVGTNLKSLSQLETACLIRQAENLTELQIKLYCPLLLSQSLSL